jgi:hypothetical protein
MGSEGSVSPSDGIPLVDVYGVPGIAWGARALLLFCSETTVELLGMIAFDPLGRRGFYTCGSSMHASKDSI